MLFSRVLALCEMWPTLSRIWTWVTMSISYKDNHYTMSFKLHLCRMFWAFYAQIWKTYLKPLIFRIKKNIQILSISLYQYASNEPLTTFSSLLIQKICPDFYSSVCCGFRIHRLPLQRGKTPQTSVLNMTLNHLIVRLCVRIPASAVHCISY